MRLPSEERDALARGKNQTRTLSGRLRMLHREGAYLIPASLTERRDFLRLAWFGCSTRFLAALSKAAVTARSAADASFFCPAATSARYSFSSVLRRDLLL